MQAPTRTPWGKAFASFSAASTSFAFFDAALRLTEKNADGTLFEIDCARLDEALRSLLMLADVD